jgi:prophage tail gpP-like protein
MNKISVEVNNKLFEGFTEASISYGIESMARQFALSITTPNNIPSPIKVQDKIVIYIDGTKQFTGYAEELDKSNSANSFTLTLQGRSLTADIIDASIKRKTYAQKDFTLLVKAVLKDNNININVINSVGLLKLDSNAISEQGESIFEFLDRYAKKVQVLLTTDANGDLVITREGFGIMKGQLIKLYNGDGVNNIKTSSVNISTKDRYNTIEVYSNTHDKNAIAKSAIVQTAKAVDNSIRNSRRLIINQTSTSKTISLTNLANWNVNVRRAKGSRYTCQVVGFSIQGEIFEANKKIKINDESMSVSGVFLIQSVNFRVDINNGAITELQIVEVGAFSLEGVNKFTKDKIGDDLINKNSNLTLSSLTRLLP